MTPEAVNPQQKLSLERKIQMHEAREGIIDRLAADLPTNIDLERFLNVVVSEIGRMLHADRCDLLQIVGGNSHVRTFSRAGQARAWKLR